MRHSKKNNHLSRKAPHRKSMLSNMACSLIMHKRIKTTLAKAKALRTYIEPLITKSKTDTTHSRRIVFSYLKQKEVITELFGDVASKVSERNGGYTRIIRLGNRIGDNSKMCYIELVDYNNIYAKDSAEKKSKRRRTRSKSKTKKEEITNQNISSQSSNLGSKNDSDKTPNNTIKNDKSNIEKTSVMKKSKQSESLDKKITNATESNKDIDSDEIPKEK